MSEHEPRISLAELEGTSSTDKRSSHTDPAEIAALRAENEELRRQSYGGSPAAATKKRAVGVDEGVTEASRTALATRVSLVQEQTFFRTMADHAPVMIWLSGLDKLCYYFNTRWLAFTGRTMRQEMGNGWAEGVHPEDYENCLAVYVSHFDARTPFQMQYRLRRFDGEWRWILDNGVPLWNTVTHVFEGFIGSCIDITEQKQLEAELRAAKNEAETAARAKIQFLALMSHEIRTPLAAVVGMADIMQGSRDPKEQRECLEAIVMSARHLQLLLNDILDVAKIDDRGVVLFDAPFNLLSSFEECLVFLRPMATQKGLVLHFTTALPPAECEVIADEARVKQIVINLVSNAIKFTNEGRIDLSLELAAGAQDDAAVYRIRVVDTGIGIPAHYKQKLFTPFTQADYSHTRAHEGTGLGLFICSVIVKAFNGTIVAADNVPSGTIFIVDLPMRRASLDQQSSVLNPTRLQNHALLSGPAAPAAASLHRAQLRILVVEDNRVNQIVIGKTLAAFGLAYDVAVDGNEAVAKAAQKHYDLILMDCQMPEKDGFQSTKEIREMPQYASTPIIALTALAIPGDRERCLEAGMNGYLSKPFSRQQLASLLQRHLALPLVEEKSPS